MTAGSAFDNRVTLTFDLDLKVNAYRATAMHCISTEFGVDSSSRFPFTARTHKPTERHKVTDVTSHSTHALAIAGVGNKLLYLTKHSYICI